jgi:histidinol phosphatase-like enzyme
MKYVFDLDGTLCSLTDGDYSKSIPIYSRIEKVNELYESGNNIVIYTARGMKRSNDDVKKSSELFEKLTKEQLRSWGVKFHSLVMGKPSSDVYIDDKGVKDYNFFKDQ